jgi:hypothetical protein
MLGIMNILEDFLNKIAKVMQQGSELSYSLRYNSYAGKTLDKLKSEENKCSV